MDASRLTEHLSELAARHRVPGASVAVLADGAVTEAAYGVLNVATGVETTTDSLFQIGSITKVYTTMLIMQLADEGLVALDEPVVTYLPEFAVADPDVTKQVTVRHLLCHTSGIDGDHFVDAGRGDDCLERYVETLTDLGQSHALGATMSYCNVGFSVLGRVIEKVLGTTWDAALQERLVKPLGLTHTVTLPEDAIRFRAAIGHAVKPGEDAKPSPVWSLMRAVGPAGLISATAADVIAFARLHLDGGTAPGGTRVLSEGSVTAMQQPQVAIPDRWTLGDHWGLGWILFNWDERFAYGHDGGTIGQSAFLRIVPDASVAVALLTNGGNTGDLYQDLYRVLLAELAGLRMPSRPEPAVPAPAVDLGQYVGVYERAASRIEVSDREGALHAKVTTKGSLAALLPNPVQELELLPVDPAGHLFVTRPEGAETWVPAVFFSLDDGSRYLHFGARATPRVS